MIIANDVPLNEDAPAPATKKKARGRKTSTKPTRIYSYRILPPEDPAHRKLVDDQFFLAHQYRSRLVEIEIELRERFRKIDLDHPLTAEATYIWEAQSTALDAWYDELRAAKSGRAPEDRDLEHLVVIIQDGKTECAKAWRDVKAAREDPEAKSHHQAHYVVARENAAKQRLEARETYSSKGLIQAFGIREASCLLRDFSLNATRTIGAPRNRIGRPRSSHGWRRPRGRHPADLSLGFGGGLYCPRSFILRSNCISWNCADRSGFQGFVTRSHAIIVGHNENRGALPCCRELRSSSSLQRNTTKIHLMGKALTGAIQPNTT